MKLIILLVAVVFIASGLCGMAGALVDWNFYTNRHARFWLQQFGRSGTRVMIGFVGAVTAFVGLLSAIWCWPL